MNGMNLKKLKVAVQVQNDLIIKIGPHTDEKQESTEFWESQTV